jgi:hypothetical protein
MSLQIYGAYWVVPEQLLAGPYPLPPLRVAARDRINRLLDMGIQLFVDLTERGEAPPYTQVLKGRARYLSLPIPDFDVPSRAQMVRTLDAMDQALMAHRKVYVHCFAGLGRTGTVVGCYLVRHGLDGAEALQRIRELRRMLPSASDPSPTTDAQRQMVRYWRE